MLGGNQVSTAKINFQILRIHNHRRQHGLGIQDRARALRRLPQGVRAQLALEAHTEGRAHSVRDHHDYPSPSPNYPCVRDRAGLRGATSAGPSE